MTYIRTKDEILSNVRLNIEDIDSILTDQRGWIKKCNVVKQAYTIEELIDEFIQDEALYDGENKYYILPKCTDKPIKTIMSGIKQHLKDGNIYGAIWTKWGLKYVAKMNKNGGLELIFNNVDKNDFNYEKEQLKEKEEWGQYE